MTSFKGIQQIEQYIFEQMPAEERLIFEAQVLINPALRTDVFFQNKVYQVIKLFTRRELRRQAEMIHNQIFNDPTKADIQQTILELFNP